MCPWAAPAAAAAIAPAGGGGGRPAGPPGAVGGAAGAVGGAAGPGAAAAQTAVVDRKSLQNIRVVQRNLIYVIGIPPNMASEDVLRRGDYFGQYGKIVKVVVNRNHNGGGSDPRAASASAYITFAHKEDAKACIQVVDGFNIDGRSMRASFGTTKYCNAFLRNMSCSSPDCLYLHELGEDEDSFTKEQIQSGTSSAFKSNGARNDKGQQIVTLRGAGGRRGRVSARRRRCCRSPHSRSPSRTRAWLGR